MITSHVVSRLFVDKAWGYGDPDPDHYFLALNYRMSELQGAVALAQLGKLEASVKQRQGDGCAPDECSRRAAWHRDTVGSSG